MKKMIFAAALAALCGFSARAQQSATMDTNAIASPVNYSADNYVGRFGAGVILGEPVGASLKYWFNDTMAVDGAFGARFWF